MSKTYVKYIILYMLQNIFVNWYKNLNWLQFEKPFKINLHLKYVNYLFYLSVKFKKNLHCEKHF